jgi:hypothetical protein
MLLVNRKSGKCRMGRGRKIPYYLTSRLSID